MTKKTTTQTPGDERLRLEYMALDEVCLWERNPKKHDVGAIWKSIQEHGFKDPPKIEPRLNSGRGGFVEGNGRSHVLREMQVAKESLPRGVGVNTDGQLLNGTVSQVIDVLMKQEESRSVAYEVHLANPQGDANIPYNLAGTTRLYHAQPNGALAPTGCQ